jgi:catechol 2,3-dioxygenase-like lactoylglutathione lyase family enzyme
MLSGVHHLTLPVSDIEAGMNWYATVFGARRRARLDHHDESGGLFAVVVELPGLSTMVELRLSPETARAVAGYSPVTFGVSDRKALDTWVVHLDACRIPHSGVRRRRIGESVDFASPDGLALRLYTDPVSPLDEIEFTE